ncbi:uncharacterized protein LOC123678211 isoform X2 [Harmonia axyridis]|uniref:uncharacterized protein LOC123678211 isoform X2 n=1 Tax=Harmonia axyridis TaxID=115357 RepID=UPI001E275928|nr:uncharacterized protein LOC123678211 isoform X2 [Harmonia axyridis]
MILFIPCWFFCVCVYIVLQTSKATKNIDIIMDQNQSTQNDQNPFDHLDSSLYDSSSEMIELHEKAASIPVVSNPREELSSDVPKIVKMIEKKSDTTTKPDVVQTVPDRLENNPLSEKNDDANNRVMTVQERKMKFLKLTQLANDSYKSNDQEKDMNDVTDVMATSNRRRSTGEPTSISSPTKKAEDKCKLEKAKISTDPHNDEVKNPSLDQKSHNQSTQDEQNLKKVPQTIEDDPKFLEKTTELIKQFGENNKRLLERHEMMKAAKESLKQNIDAYLNSKSTKDNENEMDQNGIDPIVNGNGILNGKNHEGTTVIENNQNGHDSQVNGTNTPTNGISSGISSNEAVNHETRVDGDWQNDKAETVNNVPSDNEMDADVGLQKSSAETTTRIPSEQQNIDDHPEQQNGEHHREDSPTSTTEIISEDMPKIRPDQLERLYEIEKELEHSCSQYAEYRREVFTKGPSEFEPDLIDLQGNKLLDRQIAAKLNNLYFDSTSSEEEIEVQKWNGPTSKYTERKSNIEDMNVSAAQTDDSEPALEIDTEYEQSEQGSVPTTSRDISYDDPKQAREEQNEGFNIDDFLEGAKLDPKLYSFSPSNKRVVMNLLSDVEIFSRAALAILRAERTPVIPNIKFRIPSPPQFEAEIPESIRHVFEAVGHMKPRLPTQQRESSSTERDEPSVEFEYVPFSMDDQSNEEKPSTSDEPYSKMRESNLFEEAGIHDKPDSKAKTAGSLLVEELLNRNPWEPYHPQAQDAMMQVLNTYAQINAMHNLTEPQFNEAMPEEPYSEEIPDFSDEPMDTEILPKDRRKGIITPDEVEDPPEENPPTGNPNPDPLPANPEPPQGESNPSAQNPQSTSPRSDQAGIHYGDLNLSEERDLSKYVRQSDNVAKDQDDASVPVSSKQVPNTLKPLPLIGNEDEPIPMMQDQSKPTGKMVATAPIPERNSPIPPQDEQMPEEVIPENPIQPEQPQEEDGDTPPRARAALTSNQVNSDIITAADYDRSRCRPRRPNHPPPAPPGGDNDQPEQPAASMRLDPVVIPFLEEERQSISEHIKQVTGQEPDVSPTPSNDSNDSQERKKIRRRRRTKSLNEPKSPKFRPVYHPGTNNEYASPLYQEDSPEKNSRQNMNKPRDNLIVKPSPADKDQDMDIDLTAEQKEDETVQVVDIPTPSLPPQEMVSEEIPSKTQNQRHLVQASYLHPRDPREHCCQLLSDRQRQRRSHRIPNLAVGIDGIMTCNRTVNTEGTNESGDGQNPNEKQEQPAAPIEAPNNELIPSNNSGSGNGNIGGSPSDDEDRDKNTQKRSRKKSPEPPTGSPVIDKAKNTDDKENDTNILNPPDRSFFKNRSKSDENNPKVDAEGGLKSQLSKSNEFEMRTAPERVLNSSSDSNSSDYMQPIQRCPYEAGPAEQEHQRGGVQMESESMSQASSKRKCPPTPDIEGGPNKILAREDDNGQLISKPNEEPGPSSPMVGKPARITQRRMPVPSESDLSESDRGQSVLSESGISEIDDFPEDVSEGSYANSRRMTRNQAAQIEAYQQQQQQQQQELYPVDEHPPTPPTPVLDEGV